LKNQAKVIEPNSNRLKQKSSATLIYQAFQRTSIYNIKTLVTNYEFFLLGSLVTLFLCDFALTLRTLPIGRQVCSLRIFSFKIVIRNS